MDLFWKAVAAIMIAVILELHLGNKEKSFGTLLAMAVCCMAAGAAMTFLEPVLELLRELEALTGLHDNLVGILMKCTGIALVAELAGLVCRDAGNGALGKAAQLLGSAGILYLSIPMIQVFLKVLQEILGEL